MAEIYDEEAVQQILQLAIARQSSKAQLSRSQLVEIAEDLGISMSDLQAAEQQWQIQKQTQEEHQAFHAYQHERLQQSAVKYLIVNTFLLLINAWINQTLSWSVPIALIWGLFLALQAWQTFHPEGQSYEKAFQRWRLRQQVGQSLKTFSEKLKELATSPKGTT